MKKKLEAELISIAHRILKLKNRAELDQLQAETLKLYEKLSVLKFVEDNFADVKPTIGYSSAEGKLEEIYGKEEVPEVKANEVEAAEDKAREEKDAKKAKTGKGKQDKENDSGEGVTSGKEKVPVAEGEEEETEEADGEAKPEGNADPEQKVEEYQASEEEKAETEESGEQTPEDETEEPAAETEEVAEEEVPEEDKVEDSEEQTEEPEHKIEVVKPEEGVKAMENGAAAVFEKEDDSTIEEEEKAADAEVITIEPDKDAKIEEGHDVAFAFERKPAPEEPVKQKEISFEDFHDYREPEFVKKEDSAAKEVEAPKLAETPKEEEPKTDVDDWRNWEPSKPAKSEQEEPKREEPKESAVKGNIATREGDRPRSLNDAVGKTISLGLNDRIAFEKHLFGGSSDDLNRVMSQLNTHNSLEEAKNFIEDLVKPDYNNWKGKEEYEERFMVLVEKKFE